MISAETVKRRATSRSAWVLPKEESCVAPDEVWSNKDMDPAPMEHRIWTSWTFFAYWISDLITPGGWATSSSFIELGLTWWESCLAMYVGGFLVAIVITSNGYIGAKVHTPFAVTSRSVFGYWGSKFVVFSRMCTACFWLSINSWSGGVFISLMIEAIWPSYANLKNSIPASQGATSKDFLSFFLFWLLQFPFIFIHPSKLKWVFNVKAALVPIVACGTLIWACIIASPNTGKALGSPANRAEGGTARFMAFMYAVTAAQSTWATLSVNIGDFSRYCKKPSASYIQMIVFPLLYAGLSFFASITASCVAYKYGTENSYYQPYDIVALWNTSAGGRCAMFLASFVWAMCNVTTNITANSISAANDMTSLAPKYINIRRGQFIAVTIGVWGFVPWKVLATASNFLTFMSSYSVVLAPIAVIMVVDFFFVKKQKLNVYELYKPKGIYRYSKGWNWRAYVALAVAVAPNLPGMANAINDSIYIGNIKYIYMVSNIFGNIVALTIYLLLNRFFPPHSAIIETAVHDVLNEPEYTPYDSTYPVAKEEAEVGVEAWSAASSKNGEKGLEGETDVKSAI
ncbi:hypothetical protein L202_05139 [Cryptococcus amylolentus CBS 6039]|uniref:Uracil transporter FurD n=2 Tax=Cryptococcus amylolentus TaxID=104669 RepID=A0A1E3HNX4_9TREE|nr:hypothetical protein L202_05139 [Cryptococcus amylolentus CBS 6039]ODN78059.1 hypothetical protein L202_05139 [Cryptococcus amylolentus CBS 6039]ODO06006.1 hypothetical protein I350_05067 [Cryptococcus amylolentus CBS 6273]